MCNPVKAASRFVAPITGVFDRAITMPDNGRSAMEAENARQLELQTEAQQRTADAQIQANQQASDAAAAALDATKKASAQAAAAATPAIDSESAVRAADDRMRKLIAAGTFNGGNAKKLFGSADVGYRVLTGS